MLTLAFSGCRVFDESLHLKTTGTSADSGATDANGADTAAETSPNPSALFELADRCDQTVPKVVSSAKAWSVDTRNLRDDLREFSACLEGELRGPDGFVAIEMKKNEKWHMHINPLSPMGNPALVLMGACDGRSCQRGMGIDECGAGKSEHLSFVAPATQTYYLGIDSRDLRGAGEFEVLVVRPTCGNGGVPEHSETCDDGNVTPGDGCDQLCRKEMAAPTDKELEPNDDSRAANVLKFPAGATTWASATVASTCDIDLYAIALPAGAVLKAKLTTPGGMSCPNNSPTSDPMGTTALRLELVNSDGIVLGTGAPIDDEGCPSIDGSGRDGFAKITDAGEYFLRVSTRTAGPIDYRLKVEQP